MTSRRFLPAGCFAAALLSTAALPASAVVLIDTTPNGTNGTFAIGSRNNLPNGIAQSFMLPATAGSDTLLDTFEIEVDSFIGTTSSSFGAELRGYLGVFGSTGNDLSIIGADPQVQISPTGVITNSDTTGFESFTFAPRDASGDLIELMSGSQYAVLLSGRRNDTLGSFVQNFEVQVKSSSAPASSGYSEGEVTTFGLTSADLGIGDLADGRTTFLTADIATLITLVPEPASAVLLAGSGLLLARRRRA